MASISEVLGLLRGIGWQEVLVLEGARPRRVVTWSSGGHLHARVDYGVDHERVSVVQAEGEGLPPGDLISIRGDEAGISADGNFYWTERDFVISLAPGRREIAVSLTWVST